MFYYFYYFQILYTVEHINLYMYTVFNILIKSQLNVTFWIIITNIN